MLTAVRNNAQRVLSVRFHSTEPLKRTPFYELHENAGAKFIDFCGWEMPVQYKRTGVLREIQATRKHTTIFDVSHMGQVRIYGPDRERFIERATVADMQNTPYGTIRYTVIPNARGGTIDDAVVCRLPDHLHLVVNAACYDKDMAHLAALRTEFPGVQLEPLYKTHALVAVQGPEAERTLAQLMAPEDQERLRTQKFMTRELYTLGGVPNCIVSRSGYTGEDGFEVAMPLRAAVELVDRMSKLRNVCFAGLGARDTLRLEAGLTLYGHDPTDDISLVESSLNWTVSKRRRQEGGFIGADAILRQIREGAPIKRIGFMSAGAPPRQGATVHNKDGRKIGTVASGSPSPTTGKNVAMAFVETPFAKVGTPIFVNVRGRMIPTKVTKMPFVPHHYK